ncbi:hypothetical protein ACIGO9_19920 [Nocardia asteroides]|uniref:hypothetical protein n=1 Tax=Nocardia asteroides TaxID=1824 RepID=UPI0037C65976
MRTGSAAMKPRSSAKWVSIERGRQGIMRARIEHDTIKGCTPAMMRWWIENLASTSTWDGEGFGGPAIPLYQYWHHHDHISVTAAGDGRGFAVGDICVVRELLNQTGKAVETHVLTDRLDDTGWDFRIKMHGVTVGHVIHHFGPDADGSGLRFYVESRIGLTTPIIGWLMNWLIVPRFYSRRDAENWILHNVEETGQSERVIPPIYAEHCAPVPA